MQHQEFEPPEELRGAVKCFWHNCRDAGEGATGFEVIPDGYAEIIFHFGGLWSVSDGDDRQAMPSPFLMGLLGQPIRFHAPGRLEIVGVRCFPWAVFDLLGLPPGPDAVRVLEHPLVGLQSPLEACLQSDRKEEALALVTQCLLRARSQAAVDTTTAKAGAAMTEAGGTLPVSGVAAAALATVRTLERKFKRSSGHTVKDVSGLMRFERVRNRLWLHPEAPLADLAYEMGYTDQSHLSREFKRYSGTTPAAFARKAKERNGA